MKRSEDLRLSSLDELVGYQLLATDGEIGRVKDFLFDERSWVVRYLVADTGKWIARLKVLIVPIFLGNPNREKRDLPVDLTRKTIEASPALDEHAPISRQKEMAFYRYYQIPPYWVGKRTWGLYPTLDAMQAGRKRKAETEETFSNAAEASKSDLRAANEVRGYYIAARDDDIGHIEDMLIDTEEWAIRWLVVDTRNWLPGRKVLLPPSSVERISWGRQKLYLTLTREQVENRPDFDPFEPIREGTNKKLNDQQASEQAWEDLKDGTDDALDALKEAAQEAKKRFD